MENLEIMKRIKVFWLSFKKAFLSKWEGGKYAGGGRLSCLYFIQSFSIALVTENESSAHVVAKNTTLITKKHSEMDSFRFISGRT